jgi:retron-type reverse transcriptase
MATLQNNTSYGLDYVLPKSLSLKAINKLSEELKMGTYRPRPSKRVKIPGNNKLRPLGIANSRDKVVQEALKNLLEPLFEPTFLDSSHGFRPKKSCHSALKRIELE